MPKRDSGIRSRAAEVDRLDKALHNAVAATDGSPKRYAEWQAAAEAFNAALEDFYGPFEGSARRIRTGDRGAMEEAVLYLEADPWCHRSGYLKEELMSALANTALPEHLRARLRAVVINRVKNRENRLLRPAARLAASVWDDELAERLRDLEESGTAAEREDATTLLRAVDHQMKTLAGQRLKRRA